MKPSYKPIEHGFKVKIMSPLGSYPDTTVDFGSSILVITHDLCFSVVRLKGEDWSFSEVDSLPPLEIPLVGVSWTDGRGTLRIHFYNFSKCQFRLATKPGNETRGRG